MAEDGSGQTGLYESLVPPFQQITDTNRGPIALVVATTFMIITTLTVMIKVYTMYARTRKLAWGDGMMILALCLGIGYTICICLAVNHGLGRIKDELEGSLLDDLSQNYYAMNILLVLSLASAKVAVTLLVIAIRPSKTLQQAAYGVLGVTALWAIASAFALGFQCSPDRWALGPAEDNTCVNQYTLQASIRGVDIAIDVAIVLLPICMMRSVQVSQRQRIIVMILFGIRLVTPIFTAASISVLPSFYNASLLDRPSHAATLSVWTTVVLNLSIMTACVPSIKRFLADWAAGMSAATISDPFELEHSAGKSGVHSQSHASGYGESNLGSKIASRLGLGGSRSRTEVPSAIRSRNDDRETDEVQYGASSHTRKARESPSADTSDSVKGLMDGVIMHTVDYKVEFEERAPPTQRQR